VLFPVPFSAAEALRADVDGAQRDRPSRAPTTTRSWSTTSTPNRPRWSHEPPAAASPTGHGSATACRLHRPGSALHGHRLEHAVKLMLLELSSGKARVLDRDHGPAEQNFRPTVELGYPWAAWVRPTATPDHYDLVVLNLETAERRILLHAVDIFDVSITPSVVTYTLSTRQGAADLYAIDLTSAAATPRQLTSTGRVNFAATAATPSRSIPSRRRKAPARWSNRRSLAGREGPSQATCTTRPTRRARTPLWRGGARVKLSDSAYSPAHALSSSARRNTSLSPPDCQQTASSSRGPNTPPGKRVKRSSLLRSARRRSILAAVAPAPHHHWRGRQVAG
jgi:hypothetical protein